MDVAITGSSGLIGSSLRSYLNAKGHRVLPVVRRTPGAGEIGWDPDAGTIDAAGFEGIDAVVHLAGSPVDKRFTEKQKRRLRESRVQGTSLIATTLAGLQKPPEVLLSASAIGYYGDRGDEVLDEESKPGTDFFAQTCLAWEEAARPAADAGLRVANFRTGIVQTPEGSVIGKVGFAFKLGLGGKLGKGDQWWSWISIDDEVGAIDFLLDSDVSGPVNLTAPEPVTNAEWTKALGEVLGRPAVLTVPRLGPRLLLGKEGAATIVEVSQRVMPTVLTEAGYQFRHRDIRTALRAVMDKAHEIAT